MIISVYIWLHTPENNLFRNFCVHKGSVPDYLFFTMMIHSPLVLSTITRLLPILLYIYTKHTHILRWWANLYSPQTFDHVQGFLYFRSWPHYAVGEGSLNVWEHPQALCVFYTKKIHAFRVWTCMLLTSKIMNSSRCVFNKSYSFYYMIISMDP
jgi:hypothetical protein